MSIYKTSGLDFSLLLISTLPLQDNPPAIKLHLVSCYRALFNIELAEIFSRMLSEIAIELLQSQPKFTFVNDISKETIATIFHHLKLILEFIENKTLVFNNVYVEQVNRPPLRPLALAIKIKHGPLVRLLIANGHPVDRIKPDAKISCKSPLMLAVLAHDLDMVRLLLTLGADPNLLMSHGSTNNDALDYAREEEKKSCFTAEQMKPIIRELEIAKQKKLAVRSSQVFQAENVSRMEIEADSSITISQIQAPLQADKKVKVKKR